MYVHDYDICTTCVLIVLPQSVRQRKSDSDRRAWDCGDGGEYWRGGGVLQNYELQEAEGVGSPLLK